MGPFISAHRGNCGVSGLPAAERYDRAIQLGVDYVELDVRRTADGVYVNYHDHVTPSGRPIGSLKYADLKTELGAELLALAELLDVVAGRAGVHIDLKEPGYEAEIVSLVLAGEAGSRPIPIHSRPVGKGASWSRPATSTRSARSRSSSQPSAPGSRWART